MSVHSVLIIADKLSQGHSPGPREVMGDVTSDMEPKPRKVTLSCLGPNRTHDGLRMMNSSSHFCRLPLGREEVVGFGCEVGGGREILGIPAALALSHLARCGQRSQHTPAGRQDLQPQQRKDSQPGCKKDVCSPAALTLATFLEK